jgi:hypothetical protein
MPGCPARTRRTLCRQDHVTEIETILFERGQARTPGHVGGRGAVGLIEASPRLGEQRPGVLLASGSREPSERCSWVRGDRFDCHRASHSFSEATSATRASPSRASATVAASEEKVRSSVTAKS